MTQSKTRFSFFFLMTLLAALVACAAPTATDSGAPAAIPFVGGTTAASPTTDTPPTAPEATAATETDANGIPVGFTTEGRPYRGRLDAPVMMEAFSDFQCPYCGQFSEETLPSLLAGQVAGGDMVFVFYDFPLSSIHPQAAAASNAARCAGEEGAAAYWAMHDRLFADIDAWANDGAAAVFRDYAAEMGLDEAAFDAVAQRLLELETQGAIDVMNMSRDARNGLRRLNAIRFVRVA